jgi:hypothetical protein
MKTIKIDWLKVAVIVSTVLSAVAFGWALALVSN